MSQIRYYGGRGPQKENRMSRYRKIIAAAVGLAVAVGVLDPGLEQDAVAVLTAIAVYLVPND